jgi:hypothetical protein
MKPHLQETDIPPYPFAKIGLDLSGPYPTSLSGNKYIESFIYLHSGWPEAFAVPDKSAVEEDNNYFKRDAYLKLLKFL